MCKGTFSFFHLKVKKTIYKSQKVKYNIYEGEVTMKNNLTQQIERYLLDMLMESNDRSLEIRRIELAQELGCAPSQITYVLDTRFTNGKGFSVESRRGNGGFVRISRINVLDDQEDIEKRSAEVSRRVSFLDTQMMDQNLTFEEISELPVALWKVGLTSRREAELLNLMMDVLHEWLPSENKSIIAKKLLKVATKPTTK